MGLFSFGEKKTLSQLIKEGDIRAVRKMLKKGANPNRSDPEDAYYPLHHALGQGPEMVKLLIEYNANVNMPAKGRTPLAIAEAKKYDKVVDILSDAGGRLLGGRVDLMDPPVKRQLVERIRSLVRKTKLRYPGDHKRDILDRVRPLISYPYPEDMSSEDRAVIKKDMEELIIEEINR